MTIGAHRLSNRAGVTYRQIDYWTRVGLLEPIKPDVGRGRTLLFADDQIPIAQYMGQLTDLGVQPRTARDIAGQLVDQGRAQLGPFAITVPVTTTSA